LSLRNTSILVPIRNVRQLNWGPHRQQEPVTTGISFPSGAVTDVGNLVLKSPGGRECPLQSACLDRWPDGSVRWALLDFQASFPGEYQLSLGQRAATHEHRVVASQNAKGIDVSTGVSRLTFGVGQQFPIGSVQVSGREVLDRQASAFILNVDGREHALEIADVRIHHDGPIRAEVEVRAKTPSGVPEALEVSAVVELFAGSATTRVSIRILNSQAARHPRGIWLLGDAGSIVIRSAEWRLMLTEPVITAERANEPGATLAAVTLPWELFQESSGGEAWQSPVHRNRDGVVPLRFRGFRETAGATEAHGLRASPICVVRTQFNELAIAVPEFWQNFPRALRADKTGLVAGLFPSETPGGHELQGGEQKTNVMVVAFGPDAVSDPPLSWVHDPQLFAASPEWNCSTGAIPFLVPATQDRDSDYLRLAGLALDARVGFNAKREPADEFGWRNFGDLHADHESSYLPPGKLFVSHYNNQYDPLGVFILHFLRSAEPAWWDLVAPLAAHVRDIDIYRTTGDKPAYNGGLFWHTQHYVDAGTSTHRTYPAQASGGGPAAEHNYPAGLMLHYFLTGQRASRDAAILLARWVIQMDSGSETVWRWLSRTPTGLASASGSMTYHGPGRGAGNSVQACLVGHQLTGDRLFLDKAEELVRRCIHPEDDLQALDLFDVERRWYYTVFLQALGAYLTYKEGLGELDAMYAHARGSLLHYARWVAKNERPYLEHPERLEFPNETWAAQDMRKGEVLLWAARYVDGEERARFLERAAYFIGYSVTTLLGTPKGAYARPLVLALANGVRAEGLRRAGGTPAEGASPRSSPPKRFEPQRTIAVRRAAYAVILALIASIGVLLWIW
jgi:PcRGLX-like N-terminal RIFT barrel domain